MSLRRLDCLGCEKRIGCGATSVWSKCSGCGRGFERVDASVRPQAPQPEKRRIAPLPQAVDRIATDADCDAAVRAGITKLRATLEEHAKNLRRSVPLHEIDGFLRDFRSSLDRSKSLAGSVAKALAIEDFVEEAEGEE
jgi:hypothetical protein